MCACRANDDCGPGTANQGWPQGDNGAFISGFDGCPNSAVGRRLQVGDTDMNSSSIREPEPENLPEPSPHPNSGKTTELGRKLKERARWLGQQKAKQRELGEEHPPLELPSRQSLEDEDCVEWDHHTDVDGAEIRTCTHHEYTYWRSRAAQKRFKLLLAHHSIKDLWEMNKDGDVPDDFPYLSMTNTVVTVTLRCTN